MILEIYVVLLVAALVATAGVIWLGSTGGVGSMQVDGRTGIVLSAAVFLLWGLLAIESYGIVSTSGGQEFVRTYEELAWLCVGGAVISLLSMVQASIKEIENTGGL